MIILLNFLIAILCEAFDDVNSKAKEHTYIQRASMNRETYLTLKVLGYLKEFQGFNLCCNCRGGGNDDPLDAAVDDLKEGQESIRDEINEVKSQVTSFQESTESHIQEVKDMIAKDM